MRSILALVVAIGGIFLGSISSAGTVWTGTRLTTYSDGSGIASGTLASFRGSAGANDYAGFGMDSGAFSTPYVYLRLGNKTGYCEFRQVNSDFQKLISAAMSYSAYFRVVWDSSGRCIQFSVSHGSMY
jgi:hypothetical protein